MTKIPRQTFDHLSPAERAVVGDPEDFNWDASIELAPRSRPDNAQFSLRVERSLLSAIHALARQKQVKFSDVARQALEQYVSSGGGESTATRLQVTFASAGILVQTEGIHAEIPANYRFTAPDERIEMEPQEADTVAA